jgi:hypothetical protein
LKKSNLPNPNKRVNLLKLDYVEVILRHKVRLWKDYIASVMEKGKTTS